MSQSFTPIIEPFSIIYSRLEPFEKIYEYKSDDKFIMAIDNDECIGSWAELSLLYSIYEYEYKKQPSTDLFVQIIKNTLCIRQGVDLLYKQMLHLKKMQQCSKIYMFTAASNSNGWVTFLASVLEKWYGEKIYDEIIYREMIDEYHYKHNTKCMSSTGYIKNLNMIREMESDHSCKIIAIDDRPENILNGISIGVSPFKIAINLSLVIKIFMRDEAELLISKYEKMMCGYWEQYLLNPLSYTKTIDDFDITDKLEIILDIIDKI